jgi:hypothetical protein
VILLSRMHFNQQWSLCRLSELASDLSEVERDSLTHKLVLVELVQVTHPGIDRPAGSQNACPLSVPNASEADVKVRLSRVRYVAPRGPTDRDRWPKASTATLQ